MFPSWWPLQLGFGFAESAESGLESVHVKLDNITATLGATLLVPTASLQAPPPRCPPPLSLTRRHPSS